MGDDKEKLTNTIIGCIIKVHQSLGPGFLENVYRRALMIELAKSGLHAETEKEILVLYEGQEVGRHRLDILVEATVIIELKTVDELARIHYFQLKSYLKASRLSLGILVNFAKEKADFRRVPYGPSISISPTFPSSPYLTHSLESKLDNDLPSVAK